MPILGFDGVFSAQKSGSHKGIQRRVRVFVHVLGDFLSVDQVGSSLSHGFGLGGIRLGSFGTVWLNAEVEHDEMRFASWTGDHLHRVVFAQIGNIGSSQGIKSDVNLVLLDRQLEVGGISIVAYLHGFILRRDQSLIVWIFLVYGEFVEFEL